jgi:hypothetical protein
MNGINKASFHNDSINFMEKVKKLNSDITGLNEVKLYTPKLASQDKWNVSRVKKSIPGAFTRYTYNNTEPHDQPHLAGGVGIIATKEAAVRHKSSSNDPTGLGRWTSILLGGREDYNVRYVCVYNPVKSENLDGSYLQQQRHFLRNDNTKDPLEILQADICQALDSWVQNGEHVVLMLDANQDIQSGSLSKAFIERGLQEAIISRHDELNPPVPTYNRGSNPIDGIFTTLDITQARSGYLAFGEGLESDHRVAWLDIPYEVAFGHNPPHLHKLEPSRLSLQDPQLVAKLLMATRHTTCLTNSTT